MKEVENDISGTCTLIKRLTKSERAFITKKLSASKGNKIHKQLFDIIIKTNSFEEEEIKKLFISLATSANYTLVKSQVLELTLKYLGELEASRTLEYQLFQKLGSAVILGRKMLRPQGIKIAHAVLKESERYDFFAIQFKAYEVLFDLATKMQNLKEVEEVVAGIEKLIGKQKMHNQVLDLTHRANVVFFKMNARSEFKEKFEEIKSEFVEVKSDSLKIKCALNHLRGFVSMVYECDYAKALTYFEENVSIIENAENFGEKYPNIYRTAVYNVAICLDSLNDEERFLKLSEKIIATDNPGSFDSAEEFGKMMILRMSFLQTRKRDKEVVELIEEHEKRILSDIAMMTSGVKLAFLTNCTISYVKCDGWKKALRWNNLAVNESFAVYHDVQCFNKILNLIIHYELGNIEVLESNLPNAMRFLVSHGHYDGSFKAMYEFFQKYAKDFSEENEKFLLVELQMALRSLPVSENFNMTEFNEIIAGWVDERLA